VKACCYDEFCRLETFETLSNFLDMTKQNIIVGLEALIERQVGNAIAQKKQASQFSPNSATNAETPGPSEPKVNPKLQNTGEGYEPATVSELGMERHRDLVNNQVDVPIPDKGVTADTRDAISIIPCDNAGVQDALMSPGDPTMKVTDPQTHSVEPSISEKLQLKKDAAAAIEKGAELAVLGQKIVDLLMTQTVYKQANVQPPAPTITQEQLFQDAAKIAEASDAAANAAVKSALLDSVEHALYCADMVAADFKSRVDQLAKDAAAEAAAEAAPAAPSQEAPAPAATAEAAPEEKAPADPSPAPVEQTETPSEPKQATLPPDMVDPAAAAAMQDPMPGGEMSEAEANQLLMDSLAETGIDMGVPAGGEMAPDDGMDAVYELLDELVAMGVPPEEAIAALQDVFDEHAMGVDPAMGMQADLEAGKTGHYKFASIIGRPRNKTADQEQKIAKVRSTVRDIMYGPNVKDFT